MRELSFQEVADVSGSISNANFSYIVDCALSYGATGALINMLTTSVEWAAFGYGFTVGAGVGAAYAITTIALHAIN
ncbi:MAG: hypothetical protein BGO43_02875 [Gammaproteobacteria bacterium 39-13]|nr:hypothetical protein [Gammaproteobacteria bacterium]OJV85647.1 MAG: hypothetical protein BGO43_02875 [Gammaproteobacteria bacterium 39-13]